MFATIQAQLRKRAELVLSGQLALAAREYAFPLPVHLADQLMIIRTPTEAVAMLGLLRQGYQSRRVVAVQPKVTAVDLPKDGRFRVWVDWQELAIPFEGTRVSSAVYYCRMVAGRMQTEMVQYTRLSMPELNPQFAAIALSA